MQLRLKTSQPAADVLGLRSSRAQLARPPSRSWQRCTLLGLRLAQQRLSSWRRACRRVQSRCPHSWPTTLACEVSCRSQVRAAPCFSRLGEQGLRQNAADAEAQPAACSLQSVGSVTAAPYAPRADREPSTATLARVQAAQPGASPVSLPAAAAVTFQVRPQLPAFSSKLPRSSDGSRSLLPDVVQSGTKLQLGFLRRSDAVCRWCACHPCPCRQLIQLRRPAQHPDQPRPQIQATLAAQAPTARSLQPAGSGVQSSSRSLKLQRQAVSCLPCKPSCEAGYTRPVKATRCV